MQHNYVAQVALKHQKTISIKRKLTVKKNSKLYVALNITLYLPCSGHVMCKYKPTFDAVEMQLVNISMYSIKIITEQQIYNQQSIT